MRRPATFDDRLEALCADATPDQLQRMQSLAALLLRMAERKAEPAKPARKRKDLEAPIQS